MMKERMMLLFVHQTFNSSCFFSEFVSLIQSNTLMMCLDSNKETLLCVVLLHISSFTFIISSTLTFSLSS